MESRYVLAVLAGVLLVSSTVFVVDVSPSEGAAVVDFDDTITMSDMTEAELRTARDRGLSVPQAEVFYSRYRYVVGHQGIASLVTELDRDGRERQFGTPLSIYVTDYSPAELTLTEEGYVRVERGVTRWVAVEEAHFVVNSSARRPGGAAILPFSQADDARAVADDYGGRVVDWETLRQHDFGASRLSMAAAEERIATRTAWADAAAADARQLTDRPVSVVVGQDAPTLDAAIAQAPPNTTIQVPAGEFTDVNLTVRKPVTIAGAGANETWLVGTGNGSVLRVFDHRVAVTGLSIRGIGEAQAAPNVSVDTDRWDAQVLRAYGYAASGIEFDHAPGSYVADVYIDTPTNGVTVRYSDGTVIERVRVDGESPWREGFMSTITVHSRMLVQDSTFVGGRDGVYMHRGDGTVVRDNHFQNLRFGVHEMYSSGTLVANNTATETNIGIVVMTAPEDNVVASNHVTNSTTGLDVAGRASYVVENTVVGNDRGLDVGSYRSYFARNVVVGNDIGITASTLIPTNTVVDNDVVANDRYVLASLGPVRVWTDAGAGNYWAGAPGVDRDGDGFIDRAFHPTGPVDRHAADSPDVHVLANSPAVDLLRSQQGSVPGLRASGVVDEAPRASPVRPDAVADALDWVQARANRTTASTTEVTA
ncbi:NosD domain-containing protein [Haloarchaeobius amylolyticus]|uniref:NosD domain-containing protein n=1 Tax=Haloarchaeobius amylolyticus TaxID=1198296 RepID=UPI00226EB4B9|nr:NosD domain-containing protein [Haloarchaeobius amylolyticus]